MSESRKNHPPRGNVVTSAWRGLAAPSKALYGEKASSSLFFTFIPFE